MGAWGHKPFENDGAGDFEAALCVINPENPAFLKEVLEDVFRVAEEEGYLEVDDGEWGIACAALIAYMNGLEFDGLPTRLSIWAANNSGYDSRPLIPLALNALDLIRKDAASSEVYELWEEAGDNFPAWKAGVERIISHLQNVSGAEG